MRQRRDKRDKARIVLVDDHPIVREHLAQLINQQDDLTICGDCGSAVECLALLKRIKADLAIVDLSLKNSHGLDLIKDLKFQAPKVLVLVLSMHDELLYAERALRAGARGYVTKQEATEAILEAIRKVLAGEVYVSDKIARHLVNTFVGRKSTGHHESPQTLTDRELQVLQMIGQGHSTREIADLLRIDVKTVETHRAHLKDKLNLATAEALSEHARRWVFDETLRSAQM